MEPLRSTARWLLSSHRSDPLFKSTLPVPQSLLLILSLHLPSPPSISTSNSCPVFVQIFLSLTAAHSLSLLLLPVTLSFTISSISIHLLLLSLCSFSLGCLGKNGYWLCLLFPLIPAPLSFFFLFFLFFHHCVLQQYMLLLGGDVKSSRNAPCKGKKRWWYNQFYCAVRIFSGLWLYTPYAGCMKELQFACIFSLSHSPFPSLFIAQNN